MFAVQKTSIARSTVVCAAQKPVQAKAVPQQKAALATMAAFAATVLLSAAPAQADAVKSAVCASNATAKICLKDSFKK